MRLRDGKPILPIVYANVFTGTTTGLEALVTIRPHSRWDLTAAYSWFHLGLQDHLDGVANDDLQFAETPHHQLSLRSFFTLSPRLELDASTYYVSAVASQGVPRYIRTDARLAWQLRPGIELSIAGRNLGNEHQIEIRTPAELPAVTPSSRTIVGTIQWRR
jgi:iron complex outermembrane receptor protein